VIMLSANDLYRKPLCTPWEMIETHFNDGVACDKSASFYCGDAAGRVPPVVKKKDFSASDLKFALNLGIPFQTPEELFQGLPQKYDTKFAFDPRELGKAPADFPVPALTSLTLILCVGPPGSGKSSLATEQFPMCERVNQDTLKTKSKCVKACEDALKAGKSVIVDNQNTSPSDRAPYLALAKKYNASSIAVHIDVPKEMCFHLNSYRLLNPASKHHRDERVPDMVIHSFYKNVKLPTVSEGFAQTYRLGLEHFKIHESDADPKLLRTFLS